MTDSFLKIKVELHFFSYPQELISCYGELLHKYSVARMGSEDLADRKV